MNFSKLAWTYILDRFHELLIIIFFFKLHELFNILVGSLLFESSLKINDQPPSLVIF